MKQIYHLGNCGTCQKIIGQINSLEGVEMTNIKEENISASALDALKEKVGSYEALFSKRAMKFRAWGLHEMNLTEKDYRKYLLEEYTFLKRPFMINGDEVFIGNAKKDVDAALASFNK